MRISDWSSDVCSSDLLGAILPCEDRLPVRRDQPGAEGRKAVFVDPREIAAHDHIRLRAAARRPPGAEIDDVGAAAIGLAPEIFLGAEEEAAVAARQILMAEDIDRRTDMAAIE